MFLRQKQYRCADICEKCSVPAGLKSLLLLKNTIERSHLKALMSLKFFFSVSGGLYSVHEGLQTADSAEMNNIKDFVHQLHPVMLPNTSFYYAPELSCDLERLEQ